MKHSHLAQILTACADTAIYLPKKRSENLDDFKIVLFDPFKNTFFITNGDVVIRGADLPQTTLQGLSPDVPAYDYLEESFIPNPLPFSPPELEIPFDGGDYAFTVTVPVEHVIDRIYKVFDTALSRRGALGILDVGYSMFPGSILVPKFEVAEDGNIFYNLNGMILMLDHVSKISGEYINKDTPYVCLPMAVDEANGVTLVDVYKEFRPTTIIGLYELLPDIGVDDIHPFSLAEYAENYLIEFPLASTIDHYATALDKMCAYKDMHPMTFELEYFYNILLLFAAFNYRHVNIHIGHPEAPMLIEGVGRVSEDQPILEAILSPVIVGEHGQKCEELIMVDADIPF